MTELNRPQLCHWESTLQMAASALDDPRGGTHRFQTRLRDTMVAFREALEALKRMAEARDRAHRQHADTRNHFECLVEHLPIPYLLTTLDGSILAANQAAGVALNVTSRALVRRNLLVFFDDRESWMQALKGMAGPEAPLRRVCNVRPRERMQQRFVASVSAVVTGSSATIQWFLTPSAAEMLPDTGMVRASEPPHARPS